jgi:hypothetical protein
LLGVFDNAEQMSEAIKRPPDVALKKVIETAGEAAFIVRSLPSQLHRKVAD